MQTEFSRYHLSQKQRCGGDLEWLLGTYDEPAQALHDGRQNSDFAQRDRTILSGPQTDGVLVENQAEE